MAYCYYRYGQRYCTNNRWYDWGRWVLLGAIIFVALLAFFLFACISARRRRKVGQKPLMMTGWAAPGHGPVTYNPNRPAKNGNDTYPTYAHYGNENAGTAPPPAYGANADYYGSGANAQPGTYQAPQYPPPAASRGDGVVR